MTLPFSLGYDLYKFISLVSSATMSFLKFLVAVAVAGADDLAPTAHANVSFFLSIAAAFF